MGRVYRQGQKRPTTIYRLFTSGTIEEVMFQRQIQKGNLANAAFDGKHGSSFSNEDLQACLFLSDSPCDTKSKIGQDWTDYDGPETLEELGCEDQPLLRVAASCFASIGHVELTRSGEEEKTGSREK